MREETLAILKQHDVAQNAQQLNRVEADGLDPRPQITQRGRGGCEQFLQESFAAPHRNATAIGEPNASHQVRDALAGVQKTNRSETRNMRSRAPAHHVLHRHCSMMTPDKCAIASEDDIMATRQPPKDQKRCHNSLGSMPNRGRSGARRRLFTDCMQLVIRSTRRGAKRHRALVVTALARAQRLQVVTARQT